MRYEKWLTLFELVKKDILLSWDQDKEATNLLESILSKKQNTLLLSDLQHILHGQDVIIFGAGPSLVKSIKRYTELQKRCIVICADGSTSALLENGISPHIIITDLDGKISDQIKANKQGSILIVHAHGDNINILKEIVPKVKGSIGGSIQTDPKGLSSVFNVGGFTDGDRGVFLAAHCEAKTIFLAGFDFTGEIGEFSFLKEKNREVKLKKLYWCSYLIKQLQTNHDIRFLTE
jgi:2-amino-4-hydroxy-6-hydroxymethyldihydropteridine diphosphokinase